MDQRNRNDLYRRAVMKLRRGWPARMLALFAAVLLAFSAAGCVPETGFPDITDVSAASLPSESEYQDPFPGTSGPVLPLRLAARSEKNMNPLMPKHAETRAVLSLVYESPLKLRADGAIVPALAESFEMNAGHTMIRLKVREGAAFHDGQAVSTEDIRASFAFVIEQLTGKSPGTAAAPSRSFAADARNTEGSETDRADSDPVSAGETETDGTGEADPSTGPLTDESGTSGGASAAADLSGTAQPSESEEESSAASAIESLPPAAGQRALYEIAAGTTLRDGLFFGDVPASDGEDDYDAGRFSALSEYRKRVYGNVASLTVEDGWLYVGLHAPDRDAAQLFLFPVVPKAFVRNVSSPAIPGSGAWKIVPVDSVGHYKLLRVADGSGIREIEVTSFNRVSEETRAFDEGRVDLLYMGVSDTARYADRSRIRRQRFAAQGFYSLYFSGAREDALALRDALCRIIGEDVVSFGEAFAPFRHQRYPIAVSDPRMKGFTPGVIRDGRTGSGGWPDSGDPAPFVLLVPEGFFPERWIDRLKLFFARLNRTLETRSVGKDVWENTLREGDFDGALLADPCYGTLDPDDWLDGLQVRGLLAWRGIADATDVRTLQSFPAAPAESGAPAEKKSSAAYTSALERVFDRLPVLGLSGMETMVWYGGDVQGTMAGTWQNPYEKIERLTVWRP